MPRAGVKRLPAETGATNVEKLGGRLPSNLVPPPGLEPGTTVPKTVVISVSPQGRARTIRYYLNTNHMHFPIPEEVSRVTETLRAGGHQAYLVGGCVRDLIIDRPPKDWDVTTDAAPERILELFGEDAFYNNTFGTVGVSCETDKDSLKVIEITPFRSEGAYEDSRRPSSVSFGASLSEDLSRRDFTINALAYDPNTGVLYDEHKGQEDLVARVLRTVGVPRERFAEDSLRVLRAIRLVAELDLALDSATAEGIVTEGSGLGRISKERIRDEFVRILLSERPMQALFLMKQLGILEYVEPNLIRSIGVSQNQAHKYDVFEHLLRTMQHAADKDWELSIRLAGLYHDISKPETRRWSDEKKDWTFHGHEVVGARVARKALEELRFPKKIVEKVTLLVRWHMFFSDPDKVTLSAVRRIIRNVGQENIWDLLNLRICDRVGTGRPKEQPFRFRKYKSMVEEALRDPISVSMLKVGGKDLMEAFQMKPGPRIGWALHALLEEVLEDPTKNDRAFLMKRCQALLVLSDEALRDLGEEGKKRKEAEEEEEVRRIREKNFVS